MGLCKNVLLMTLFFVISFHLFAVEKAVFGDDDRVETVDAADAKHVILAKSTAAMISKNFLKVVSKDSAENVDKEQVQKLLSDYIKKISSGLEISASYVEENFGPYNLEIRNELLSEFGVTTSGELLGRGKVCPEMKFANQVAAANCSAFLVGPDLLMTAGHCVTNLSGKQLKKNICKDFAWIFDYKLSADQVRKLESGELQSVDSVRVGFENVYTCKEIVDFKNVWMDAIYKPGDSPEDLGTAFWHMPSPPKPIDYDVSPMNDYALIRLNRKVTDRAPLKVRTKGKIELGEGIVVIGHPLGLPSKVTTGGTVLMNERKHFFNADLDSFHGNSGSGVFNAETGVIEGILVRGGEVFEKDKERQCYKIKDASSSADNFVPAYTGESIEMFLTGINRINSNEELIQFLIEEDQL